MKQLRIESLAPVMFSEIHGALCRGHIVKSLKRDIDNIYITLMSGKYQTNTLES